MWTCPGGLGDPGCGGPWSLTITLSAGVVKTLHGPAFQPGFPACPMINLAGGSAPSGARCQTIDADVSFWRF